MNLSLRRSTSALLASSLLLTIGRGATLPFMTIYLSRQYNLSVDLIGYAMTIALTIGVVFSLGFGILADKFDKKRYMLLAITAFASGFIAIPLVNKALLWFTCSGFLASFVSGAFASCISQYVMVIADGDFAEKVVAVVLPVNAAMVVTLQYSVGRRLNPANIRALMTAGTLCFVIGLVGFIFSGNSLLLWGMSAAVFTVGEIIYAPGEYMLIDHIAPPGMKASYFSAQSLGWLGAAINPLVSGVVLTSLPPSSLFVILALVIIAAWVLMLKGIRARPWGQPALC
ncbi:TPA: MFS transporter [Escherichia coli]